MNISFWGQKEIIDKGLYDKVKFEINNFLTHDSTINFMFYGPEYCCEFCNKYMELCWQIAYTLRLTHPEKIIKFIKIISEEEKSLLSEKDTSKPFGQQRYDIYFCPPKTKLHTGNDYIHWILNVSDYVLYYLYHETAIGRESSLEKKDNCIDLTDNNTRKGIRNFVSILPEQHQQIYNDRLSGKRVIDIANELGYSSSTIGQIHRKVIYNVLNEFACEVPNIHTDILDNIFLAKIHTVSTLNGIEITENEQNSILKNRHKLSCNVQIKHIWRDENGILYIAYNNNQWFCYSKK